MDDQLYLDFKGYRNEDCDKSCGKSWASELSLSDSRFDFGGCQKVNKEMSLLVASCQRTPHPASRRTESRSVGGIPYGRGIKGIAARSLMHSVRTYAPYLF